MAAATLATQNMPQWLVSIKTSHFHAHTNTPIHTHSPEKGLNSTFICLCACVCVLGVFVDCPLEYKQFSIIASVLACHVYFACQILKGTSFALKHTRTQTHMHIHLHTHIHHSKSLLKLYNIFFDLQSSRVVLFLSLLLLFSFSYFRN